MRREINELGDARFQSARARREKNQEKQIESDEPKIDMGSIELPINQKAQRHQIENDRGGDKTITQPDAGQAFGVAMILGHGLQDDAPPKISVDLNVPIIPAAIDGIAPAFFLEQIEDRAEEVVTVPALFAPKNSAAQTAAPPPRGSASRQMFMPADDAARRPFEAKPGEISGPASHKRLGESETHYQQPRAHGIKLGLDPRAHHVGKRHAQRAPKHKIRHDAQRRQKNSQPEKKNRQREPFDAAEIGGQV